jgi:predicted amidohydrolase
MDAGSETLEVAVCQLTSTDDVDANVEQALSLLKSLDSEQIDIVCFPENSLYFRLRESEAPPSFDLQHKAIDKISDWARAKRCAVHLGSVPYVRQGQLFNTSVLILPSGEVQALYDKIHLFDVDVEGQKAIRESDTFSPGQSSSVFSIKGWKFGSSICYDLRFAELFLRYAREGVDVILIPSAFLVPTGRAHWHVLTRARAIESQAYVLAAAQGGTHVAEHGGSRQTYGHSLIIDPWGEVIGEVSDEQAKAGVGPKRILRATLSRERIRKVREQIPMAKHRRLPS